MAEPRVVVSPKENVAETDVLNVQDAQTRIKVIIVEGFKQNIVKTEVERRIAVVINDAAARYPPEQRDAIRQSLAINAQKWHWLYSNNLRAIGTAAINKMLRLPEIQNVAKTYSIDVAQIAGLPPSEQRAVIDRFRPYMTEDRYGTPIISEYDKRVKAQIKVLASDPANLTRVDKNGKAYTVNMRNFAEMEVRYQANKTDVQRLADDGVKLVWASSHSDASPRCAPYQGRLYSLDGSSGTTANGEKFTPLDDALAGPKGDGNGIINGYNCRHRLIEYAANSKAPKEYGDRDTKRENAVTGRQRQYERDIRNMKIQERLARADGDKESASDLRSRWQNLTKNYEAYSAQNERPFYLWRTRVTQDEVNQN